MSIERPATSADAAPEGTLVAAYCRTAPSPDSDEAMRLDSQRAAIEAFCAQRGLTIVEVFVDCASGLSRERPGLQAAIDGARDRRYSLLVVERLSRLSRRDRDLVSLVKSLEDLQVGVASVGEGIDTRTPEGRLYVSLLEVMDEHERERRSYVQRSSIRQRDLERKKKVGRNEDDEV